MLKIKVPLTNVKVTIQGQMFATYNSCVSHNSKTNKGNFIKFHRKVKQNEVCCTKNLGSHNQGQGHNPRSYVCHMFVTDKSCVSHNLKTNDGNLIKLHIKVKQTEKVCQAQN